MFLYPPCAVACLIEKIGYGKPLYQCSMHILGGTPSPFHRTIVSLQKSAPEREGRCGFPVYLSKQPDRDGWNRKTLYWTFRLVHLPAVIG